MAGYATSGRGWHNSAVAGLLRRDERVHAQSIKLVDCLRRVIASIGGYFPGDCTDVVDGLLHHRCSLLLIRSLVGGPRRHDHLVSAVHHRLTVVRLQEVLSSRCGDDARLGIGEVTLGLVVGHPRVLTTFGLGLFGSRLRLGFQRRHGFPYLLQPTLSKGQLLRQLISTLVFAVPPVFLIIRCLGLSQQLRYLRRQLRCLLLHPLVTHRLMLRCVGLDLRAVQRHVPQLHQPRLLAQRQYLYEQARQRIQIILAKVGDGPEVRCVVRRQHPEGDVLVETLGDAA